MKNIFVTGVSKGLGYGFTKYFLKESCTVYGLSRTEPKNLENDSNFKWKFCDLSRLSYLSNCLQDDFLPTKLDLVLLNAGILGEIKDLKDTALDEIQKIMDVNLWANKIILDYLMSHSFEIKQVIGISSGASVSGNRGWNGYGISKAAFNMMIKLYAAENPQIHFISLAPGLIDTGMQDYIYKIPDEEKYPTVKRLRKSRGTLDMPMPEEAAQKIANLFKQIKEHTSGSFLDIRKL